MWFSLNTIFGWIAAYRYVVLLPIAIVEGPIISVIAGFLVSTGVMEFWITLGILALGDVIGDMILYSLGRYGGRSLIEKWGHRLGITPEKMEKFEKLFNHHAVKTLLFGKWGHAFGFPILVSAGAVRQNFRQFTLVSVAGTIPKSFILLLLGYYFGAAYANINRYFEYAAAGIVALALVAFAIWWFSDKVTKRYFDETL